MQTVRSSTDYQTDLSNIEMTSQKFETFVGNSSGISQISQTASKINLVVTDGSSVGSLSLTQDMLNAIASKVNIMAQDPTSTLSTQFTLTPSKLESVIQGSGSSTTIKQTIGKIDATVSAVDGQGNVTLTDKALTAIANDINLEANESVNIIVGNNVDPLKENVTSINDNLAKWFVFNSTDGLVIREVDETTGEESKWYTVTNNNGYQIRYATIEEELLKHTKTG